MEFDIKGNFQPNKIESLELKILRNIDSDKFLKDRITPDELIVHLFESSSPKSLGLAAFVAIDKGKVTKHLWINNSYISSLSEDTVLYKMKHELYHIPGSVRLLKDMPYISKSLDKWRKIITDEEFFAISGAFHAMICDVGVEQGIFLNDPHLANTCYDEESMVLTSDMAAILKDEKDYMFHFGKGLGGLSYTAYLLAGKKGNLEEVKKIGEKLKEEMEEVYNFSHPLVLKKLSEIANTIVDNDPFADDYSPSISGKINYITILEDTLNAFCEIKKSLNQTFSSGMPIIRFVYTNVFEIGFLKGLNYRA